MSDAILESQRAPKKVGNTVKRTKNTPYLKVGPALSMIESSECALSNPGL